MTPEDVEAHPNADLLAENERLRLQIRALKGRCLSEIDHARFCEEELKIKDQWCEMCRALDSIGVSQVRQAEKQP